MRDRVCPSNFDSTPLVRSAACIPQADGRSSAAVIVGLHGKATFTTMNGRPTCWCPPWLRLAGITAAVGRRCDAGAFLNHRTSSCMSSEPFGGLAHEETFTCDICVYRRQRSPATDTAVYWPRSGIQHPVRQSRQLGEANGVH